MNMIILFNPCFDNNQRFCCLILQVKLNSLQQDKSDVLNCVEKLIQFHSLVTSISQVTLICIADA